MRIIHPRPELGRQKAFGVEFVDGVATVESLHPERELALRQHGYGIEADLDVKAPFQEALGEPIADLESLTIPKLRDVAEREGVKLSSRLRKPEIVELLSRVPADPIPGDIADPEEPGAFVSPGWAEPEGAMEAYISATPSSRARSESLIADVAKTLGVVDAPVIGTDAETAAPDAADESDPDASEG